MEKKDKPEINFKSLTTNRRYLLLSGLSGLIALMVVFSGITPQINSLFDLRREINVGQEKVATLRQKTLDLENIEAKEAFNSVELVNKILPSQKPLLELLTSLNMVAGRNRVVFVDMSLSPGKIASESADFLGVAQKTSAKQKKAQPKAAATGYDTLVVELEISGLFSDVQQFFLDIENVAPLTTITSLSLDFKSDGIIKAADNVQAELVLSSYYFNQSVTANVSSSLPNIGSQEQEIVAELKNYLLPNINVQQQIQGGGLEDLFGLNLQDIGGI